jgi:hypothetical protein
MSTYIDELNGVLSNDGEMIREKDKAYGGSWKKRGGIGAYMMLARKWDRLEQSVLAFGYDIFKAIEEDQRDESTIDDIQDLRRYLALVEAEIQARRSQKAKERAVDNFRPNPMGVWPSGSLHGVSSVHNFCGDSRGPDPLCGGCATPTLGDA